MRGASDGVLEALARARQLDDAERAHLFDPARAIQPPGARARRQSAKPRTRLDVEWTLDAITGAAAYVYELITKSAYVLAIKFSSRRGWRKDEPGDLGPPERPQLLSRAVEALEPAGVDRQQLADPPYRNASRRRQTNARLP